MYPHQKEQKSILESVVSAQHEGYKEIFHISGRELVSADGTRAYNPDKITIDNFFAFNPTGDPGKRTMVYLIETSDHRKGVVVDTGEMEPGQRFANFMAPGTL